MAAALALHRVGLRPLVLERAPALRDQGSAIALWSNAWRALDALGVGQELRAASPMLLDRFELVASRGGVLKRFAISECDAAAAGGEAAEFRGVKRGALLEALTAALPGGCVRLGCGVDAVEAGGGRGGAGAGPVLRLSDGSRLACSVLIGADGANSAVVASHLGLAVPRYAGYMSYRGVAAFPPGAHLPMPMGTVRQVFGAGVRVGMYPLSESEVYWFVVYNAPKDAPVPPTPEAQQQEALSHVDGWQWGIADTIRRTPLEVLTRSRIRDRWTIGPPGRGRVTLVGDAAHPMTPNLGQGGCLALEDAVVLARELSAALGPAGAAALAAGGTGSPAASGAVAAAAAAEAGLRRYEEERWRRALALTLRSWAFGFALQLPYAPVVAIRDAFVRNAFSPAHFLDHTAYDCGVLV